LEAYVKFGGVATFVSFVGLHQNTTSFTITFTAGVYAFIANTRMSAKAKAALAIAEAFFCVTLFTGLFNR
jgi:hypothetical protein